MFIWSIVEAEEPERAKGAPLKMRAKGGQDGK
jgi:hypothetical protein